MIDEESKDNFNQYLKTIIKQIKQIENLVNEFSDFARMPKPIFKNTNLFEILNENISLLKELDQNININFKTSETYLFFKCDSEQISRVFLNLIKNSIESIQEKARIEPNFEKNINISLVDKNDYIEFIITDNGVGFSEKNLKNILRPYFSTKLKGSGLGLSIVNKIINDHNGKIKFIPNKIGAKIIINFHINNVD